MFSPSIDVLRFAALNPDTTTDRGSAEDREDLEAMVEYAPLLNMRAGTVYPHTLVCARGEDTTVSPAHACKFIAALQHSQQGNAPCLLRIEPNADHSGPKLYDAWLGEESDWLCFVANALSVLESPHAGSGSGVDSEWTR